MTGDVACAHESTPYKTLVKLLASRRVSALPVVGNRGRVLGVVSEADPVRKQEQPARPVARLLSARRMVRVVNRLGYDIDDLSSPLPDTRARPLV
ncbi:MAG TPA: CBS domain-containing protein [Actinomycetota bacterium]|jgi:CBS domain-containing protein|nr:CBS domain-containing protein [Actinomycetota bacterium]